MDNIQVYKIVFWLQEKYFIIYRVKTLEEHLIHTFNGLIIFQSFFKHFAALLNHQRDHDFHTAGINFLCAQYINIVPKNWFPFAAPLQCIIKDGYRRYRWGFSRPVRKSCFFVFSLKGVTFYIKFEALRVSINLQYGVSLSRMNWNVYVYQKFYFIQKKIVGETGRYWEIIYK